MYLSSYYDKEPTSEIIKQGFYGYDSCGGCCTWYITNEKVESQNWDVPYNGEQYAYIFTFYNSNNLNQPLHKLIKELSEQSSSEVIKGNSHQYILLSNIKFSNLDDESEPESLCVSEDLNINGNYPDNPDDMGGLVEYILIQK